jgi:hypothetical protein
VAEAERSRKTSPKEFSNGKALRSLAAEGKRRQDNEDMDGESEQGKVRRTRTRGIGGTIAWAEYLKYMPQMYPGAASYKDHLGMFSCHGAS